MLVTITDFAESRGTDRDTVNAFIRKHPEIKEHTQREGKNVVIDTETEAFSLLDKQYPLPKMVQVIEDTESRKKLIEAQETIIKLQAVISEYKGIEARLEASQSVLEVRQALLDDKEKQLESLKEQNHALQNELGSYKKSLFGFYRKK